VYKAHVLAGFPNVSTHIPLSANQPSYVCGAIDLIQCEESQVRLSRPCRENCYVTWRDLLSLVTPAEPEARWQCDTV